MPYISKKPYVPLGSRKIMGNMVDIIGSLNTVCKEANCPNIEECFKNKTATFMILGGVCTRNCKYCSVTKGKPEEVDKNEPDKIADAVNNMGLSHVVVTSVTRDDLKDGGASHFAEVISMVKSKTKATIEVLTPDFKNKKGALEKVLKANPKIFSHNIETVRSLYKSVRLVADYDLSLGVLKKSKEKAPDILTKTGIMLGLGETDDEIKQTIKDIYENRVDFFTMGQYLQASSKGIPVHKYYAVQEFNEYRKYALSLGFKAVYSSPLVRSSYNASLMLKEA